MLKGKNPSSTLRFKHENFVFIKTTHAKNSVDSTFTKLWHLCHDSIMDAICMHERWKFIWFNSGPNPTAWTCWDAMVVNNQIIYRISQLANNLMKFRCLFFEIFSVEKVWFNSCSVLSWFFFDNNFLMLTLITTVYVLNFLSLFFGSWTSVARLNLFLDVS